MDSHAKRTALFLLPAPGPLAEVLSKSVALLCGIGNFPAFAVFSSLLYVIARRKPREAAMAGALSVAPFPASPGSGEAKAQRRPNLLHLRLPVIAESDPRDKVHLPPSHDGAPTA